EDGVLRYQGPLCVPNVDDLREQILLDAHSSQYSIHSGATTMHRDLWDICLWNGMKKDITGFVAKCLNYQQGVMRFGNKGKLSSLHVGPYLILRRLGKVAYAFELPNELASVHPCFHVSMLKKCVGDPTSIVPLEGLGVKKNLFYDEVPVDIIYRQVKRLRNKEVSFVKLLWRNQLV
ncbi:hypothetical protein MTR67_012021, partial [Solanum verrucosum]